MLKPILRWPGGKGDNLKLYDPFFPADVSHVIEPFAGGLAVSLALQAEHSIIADANADLINFYQALACDWQYILTEYRRHMEAHSQEHYYWFRDLDPRYLSRRFAAVRLLYLNHTCYNGVYRVNQSKGEFNVPVGKNGRKELIRREIDTEQVPSIAAFLRRSIVVCQDYQETLAWAREGDFVYLDPPYTGGFVAYTKDGWSSKDDERLASRVHELTSRHVRVMLSSPDIEPIRRLYSDERYQIAPISSRRSVSRDGGSRTNAAEIMVRNYR